MPIMRPVQPYHELRAGILLVRERRDNQPMAPAGGPAVGMAEMMSTPPHAAYRNVKSKKTVIDGIKFASPGEAERYIELCIMKIKGEIREVLLQPSYQLQPPYRKCCDNIITERKMPEIYKKGKCPVCGKKVPITRDIRYIADFRIVTRTGEIIIEDVKAYRGYTTPEFKMKKKLLEYRYPHLTLSTLRRNGKPKVIAALLAERDRLTGDLRGSASERKPS